MMTISEYLISFNHLKLAKKYKQSGRIFDQVDDDTD